MQKLRTIQMVPCPESRMTIIIIIKQPESFCGIYAFLGIESVFYKVIFIPFHYTFFLFFIFNILTLHELHGCCQELFLGLYIL